MKIIQLTWFTIIWVCQDMDPSTHLEHGAAYEHVRFVAHDTVFIQCAESLLRIFHNLKQQPFLTL